MTTFLAFGSDILRYPNISTQPGEEDDAGQITVNSGSTLFPDSYIVEFQAINVGADGEFSGSTAFDKITVYASQADYNAGTATYTYTPQNPGQTAPVQVSLDRMGDNYLRFDPNVLTSSDPGAPTLNEIFVAPGSDVANNTPMVFAGETETDDDGGSGEEDDGNGLFNIAFGRTICFTSGTLIDTPNGLRRIDDLRTGDLIQTVDNGAQRLLWIGTRHFGRDRLVANPKLRPVYIPEGVCGADRPTLVSRQHAILDGETLTAAIQLMQRPQSKMRIANGLRQVTYFHLLCDQHQLVIANGIQTETFYPGPQALRMLTPQQRAEVLEILPKAKGHRNILLSPAAVYGPRARNRGNAPAQSRAPHPPVPEVA